MFEVGQKVACIIDTWPVRPLGDVPFPLKRNQVVTVKATYGTGADVSEILTAKAEIISIGVHNPEIAYFLGLHGADVNDNDYWKAEWFRPLQKLDISQGLAALVGLTETTKPAELVPA